MKRAILAGLAVVSLACVASADSPKSDNRQLIAILIEVLQQDHVDVREPAWILEHSGFHVSEIAAALSGAAHDPDPQIRLKAVSMLGRLPDPLALSTLRSAENDSDPDVRAAAQDGLRALKAGRSTY